MPFKLSDSMSQQSRPGRYSVTLSPLDTSSPTLRGGADTYTPRFSLVGFRTVAALLIFEILLCSVSIRNGAPSCTAYEEPGGFNLFRAISGLLQLKFPDLLSTSTMKLCWLLRPNGLEPLRPLGPISCLLVRAHTYHHDSVMQTLFTYTSQARLLVIFLKYGYARV